MKYDQSAINEIADYNAWQLADRADSFAENDEARAFLSSIRDAVLEATDYVAAEEWEREMVEDYSGQAHEIADNAPDVYTWTKWQEFVGTQAWQEDVSELGYDGSSDMEAAAGVALYMIASRLVAALAAEIQESIVDDDESEV